MKKLLGFIGTLLLTFSLVSSASADPSYQSNTETVWASGTGDCLRSQSEIQSNDIDSFNWSVRATAQVGSGDFNDCSANSGSEATPNTLGVFLRLWRYDGSNWSVCEDSGWSYNDQSTFMWSASYSGGYGPCGEGWYGIDSYAARFTGQWNVGGPVWAGSIYLHGDTYQTSTHE